MSKNLFIRYFDDLLKVAEETLTYERVFDLIGISDFFKNIFVDITDLSKDYEDNEEE